MKNVDPRGTASDEVTRLNFSQVVSLLNEPNMCSGGAETLRQIVRHAPQLGPRSRVLEVGSNTGFSVLELAAQLPTEVYGIDIEPYSVRLAEEKARALRLPNAHFQVGDGMDIDFDDATFDLVFPSNVTSFVPDARKAVAEYYRVLKPFGTLAAVPIYYHRPPPADLLARVEQAIGVPLSVTRLETWVELFGEGVRSPYWLREYEYIDLSAAEIDAYLARVVDQESNDALAPEVKEAAASRLREFYALFAENLRYARFAILLFRHGDPTSFPILHRTRPVQETR
jgi:ubiquinone/menaquinone biosynthesis C-methylase UbiE